MGLVVCGEIERTRVAAPQPLVDLPRQVQFFFQPLRHGVEKREEPAGGEGEIGFEEPLELEQRLLVEDDGVEGLRLEAALREAMTRLPLPP